MASLRGYGGLPPRGRWPNGAAVCVSLVVNVEEGAERRAGNGDAVAEELLCDILPGRAARPPDPNAESLYAYGSRCGFFRLLRLLRPFPVTAFACGRALQQLPEVAAALAAADWEVASHGYRWLDYNAPGAAEEEAAHIAAAADAQRTAVGFKPVGYYHGKPNHGSAKLIAERLGGHLLYANDAYCDDTPFWTGEGGGARGDGGDDGVSLPDGSPLLHIPYTLCCNDMKFVSPGAGFAAPADFADTLTEAMAFLVHEAREEVGERGVRGGGGGSAAPLRVLSVGLHCRISGLPARTAGLRRFLAALAAADAAGDVWVARRMDIALFWYSHFYPRRSLERGVTPPKFVQKLIRLRQRFIEGGGAAADEGEDVSEGRRTAASKTRGKSPTQKEIAFHREKVKDREEETDLSGFNFIPERDSRAEAVEKLLPQAVRTGSTDGASGSDGDEGGDFPSAETERGSPVAALRPGSRAFSPRNGVSRAPRRQRRLRRRRTLRRRAPPPRQSRPATAGSGGASARSPGGNFSTPLPVPAAWRRRAIIGNCVSPPRRFSRYTNDRKFASPPLQNGSLEKGGRKGMRDLTPLRAPDKSARAQRESRQQERLQLRDARRDAAPHTFCCAVALAINEALRPLDA